MKAIDDIKTENYFTTDSEPMLHWEGYGEQLAKDKVVLADILSAAEQSHLSPVNFFMRLDESSWLLRVCRHAACSNGQFLITNIHGKFIKVTEQMTDDHLHYTLGVRDMKVRRWLLLQLVRRGVLKLS